ncbi:hypothetical protein ASD15_19160 [Massilia sp. Root351]|uniref:PEP-CTERM sorting domain-containing protein n=1 Tax=Massilia sp. Root351 TaxID=1736522 RepID=UPI00070F3DDD|nr:PEP-CTERM sorting domain-containing protein [Massilia sp. Root351]KQV79448.1 hypothetical protein ASD15_19160 [Massilia sp. Root351]
MLNRMLLASLLAVPLLALAAPSYRAQVLGPHASVDVPWFINNSGMIAGTVGGKPSAYVNGQLQVLGSLGAANGAGQVLGLAEDGTVVGIAHDAARVQKAFKWKAGVMTNLDPGSALVSAAYGVNDLGQAVGHRNGTPARYANGIIGTVRLPSNFIGSAIAINNAGQIAGHAQINNGYNRAWFQQNGVTTVISDNQGFTHDISEAGTVTGHINTGPGVEGSQTAFKYRDGVLELLPGLGTRSYGWAVNAHDSIVGYYLPLLEPQWPAAFLYADGQSYRLDSLLDPALGLSVRHAYDINDSNQIVAVGRTTRYGDDVLMLLSPVPEPGAWLMLSGGLALLAWRARRRRWPGQTPAGRLQT